MLMQIILVKLTLYLTDKNAETEQIHRFISRQNSVKVKKIPKKINNFNPVPATSTAGPCPTIIGLLLRFYNSVQKELQLCRP